MLVDKSIDASLCSSRSEGFGYFLLMTMAQSSRYDPETGEREGPCDNCEEETCEGCYYATLPLHEPKCGGILMPRVKGGTFYVCDCSKCGAAISVMKYRFKTDPFKS